MKHSGISLYEEIILQLQNILSSINDSKPHSQLIKTDVKKAQFIIFVQESKEVDSFYLNKLVCEHFEPLKHNFLSVVFNKSTIPPDFILLPPVEMEKAYVSAYNRMLNPNAKNQIEDNNKISKCE